MKLNHYVVVSVSPLVIPQSHLAPNWFLITPKCNEVEEVGFGHRMLDTEDNSYRTDRERNTEYLVTFQLSTEQ
jgi:hypothetical protein